MSSDEERRVAPRVTVEIKGTVSPNGRTRKEVKIANISKSGVLIRSSVPVFSLSRVQVSVSLDGKDFEGQAICVRVTPSSPWEAGLYFIDIDEESRKVLADFLDTRLSNDERN